MLPPKNQRIRDLIDSNYSKSVRAFCFALGLDSSQKINRLFKIDPRNNKYPKPSSEILDLISNKLGVSILWLQTGEGDIFKTHQENDQPNDQDEYIEPNLKLNDMTLHKLLDAIAKRDRQIECRDQQMNEMLAQQSRLISVIETLSQGTLKQSNVR